MGTLILPPASVVYLDTSPVIYSVEKVAPYAALLDPLWDEMELGTIQVISSELLLLESLVLPLKQNDTSLIADYERVLTNSDLLLVKVDAAVLRLAAQLRATTNLKTPDAIHAATALATGCTQFITNDSAFLRVPKLNVTVLHQLP